MWLYSGTRLFLTQTAATALGLQTQSLEIQNPSDIDSALEAAIKGLAEALITLPDPLTNVLRTRIIELSRTGRLATMFAQKPPVDAGGLISYGPNYAQLFRRAAYF